MREWFISEGRRFAAGELRLGAAAIEAAERDADAAGADRLAALAALLDGLGRPAGLSRPELLRRFGRSLFARLAAAFPVFFTGARSALDFLADFERQVHDELRRLDPQLGPPRIECARPDPDRVELVYRSARGLGDLAHGLIQGCVGYFGEELAIERVDDPATGTIRFAVARRPAQASGSASAR